MQLWLVAVALVLACSDAFLRGGLQETKAAWRADADAHEAEFHEWRLLAQDTQQLLTAIREPNTTQAEESQEKDEAEEKAQTQFRDLTIGTQAAQAAPSAALVPTLEMLKGLYEQQKTRVTELNKKDEKQRKFFEKKQKEHADRLTRLQESFQKKHLPEIALRNGTRDAELSFNIWKETHERGHRQFHKQLRVAHTLMAKLKGMINAYEQAIADKSPTKEAAAKLKKIEQQVAPEIVLAQRLPALQRLRRSTVRVCQRLLVEIREEMPEQGQVASS